MIRRILIPAAAVVLALGVAAGTARAHCDTLDGPVVQDARKAIESGDPSRALIWVHKGDEAEVREAFARTLAVRSLSPEARELADRSFFETLVRVHRASEGAPYTGLKAGHPEPVVTAVDHALADGQLEPLASGLIQDVHHGLQERYDRVRASREFRPNDIEAGRRYVSAYVDFVHYVEGLHTAAGASAHGHDREQVRKEGNDHAHDRK